MDQGNYKEFTSRNLGYISTETQKKISNSKLLIAGCGIGSQVAMALARMGFQKFVLIDGDTVSQTNLNRQAYDFKQIGKNKSVALAENLNRINPDLEIQICDFHFDAKSMDLLMSVDVVVDTIDFLDLKAILTLHEAAELYQKPLVSGMSVGWGSCAIYFSNQAQKEHQFRKIFDIAESETDSMSYVLKFAQLFEKIKTAIDPQVISVMRETFTKLANNQPCPAPQVAGGSYNLASLMSSLLFQHVNGDKLPESPYLVISDMNRTIKQSLFNIG